MMMKSAAPHRRVGTTASRQQGTRPVTLAEAYAAALHAGAATSMLWARIAVEYATDVRRTLNPDGRRQGPAAVSTNLLDDYQRFLRRLTLLPRLSGLRFLSELQQIHDRARR